MASLCTDRAMIKSPLSEWAGRRVHFVGIGGIGLSAIARILLTWGVRVSGSDLHRSPLTDQLAALGARISIGHDAGNIGDAVLLVVSSAISQDNTEIRAAKEKGIPVLKRADILGQMMAGKYGIAVAGTHGKTTTTAMIAYILTQAGRDPTFIVGGILRDVGSNARAGAGEHFVIEADEYDRMFLGLRPRIAVVTHLEWDHPDCFPTMADMMAAFRDFLGLVPRDGHIVACVDVPNIQGLLRSLEASPGAAVISYGLSAEALWHAAEIRPNGLGGNDFIAIRQGESWGPIRLAVPGQHNVKNALAALAVADLLEIEPMAVQQALAAFHGTQRRFEVKGEAKGITVVDDYAHHPTEIRATLATARERYPGRPIWAVFQPHTYSRTKALFDEFVAAFGDADHVIVTDIYAAREWNNLGVHAQDLVQAMNHPDARYCATLDEAVEELSKHIRSGDVLITLGAGDGCTIGERVLQSLENGSK